MKIRQRRRQVGLRGDDRGGVGEETRRRRLSGDREGIKRRR